MINSLNILSKDIRHKAPQGFRDIKIWLYRKLFMLKVKMECTPHASGYHEGKVRKFPFQRLHSKWFIISIFKYSQFHSRVQINDWLLIQKFLTPFFSDILFFLIYFSEYQNLPFHPIFLLIHSSQLQNTAKEV